MLYRFFSSLIVKFSFISFYFGQWWCDTIKTNNDEEQSKRNEKFFHIQKKYFKKRQSEIDFCGTKGTQNKWVLFFSCYIKFYMIPYQLRSKRNFVEIVLRKLLKICSYSCQIDFI